MTAMTDEDYTLAGEYVLGLLDAGQEAVVAARISTDADFAAEVEAWRLRLNPLLGPEQAAPAHIWPKIEKTLPAATLQDVGSAKLTFWRTLTAMSVTAAIFLGILLLQQPAPVANPTPMIAALGSEDGRSAITATYDSAQGTMLLTPVALDTGELYPELWIIPADGKARSLGVINGDRPTKMDVSPDMRQYMNEGALLAITPEPAEGAPGGVATGPVLASGKIRIL
ncbi:MAG: anti-sigma factor [Sphingomonadaceae bacterium]|jgi:anti-sigma-K factor RskA|uniref:anti-sigma factor n=1 Tax=Sphingorhabdus sp. TaxID=1902408 RepID=UPI002FDA5BBB|nr:anti-sigma factor [Sphingomonadaceae bacterium]